jgi:hypothetical protein
VMDAMSRRRPPFLQREVTRHGTVVWYVRRTHGVRIRIRAPFGTPEHDTEYRAALAGEPITARVDKFNPRTLGWLIERYRETAGAKGTWGDLSPATRAQRAPFLNEARDKAGYEPLSRITRSSIDRGMAARSPHTAKHFLYALLRLMQTLKTSAVYLLYCTERKQAASPAIAATPPLLAQPHLLGELRSRRREGGLRSFGLDGGA